MGVALFGNGRENGSGGGIEMKDPVSAGLKRRPFMRSLIPRLFDGLLSTVAYRQLPVDGFLSKVSQPGPSPAGVRQRFDRKVEQAAISESKRDWIIFVRAELQVKVKVARFRVQVQCLFQVFSGLVRALGSSAQGPRAAR